MTITILHPATREDWLKLREGYVSSTESAALIGMSPYITAFELALQKTEKLESDFYPTERTVWGTRLQDAIAEGIGEDYGVVVRPQRGYAIHPETRMGSSFDYEVVGLIDDLGWHTGADKRDPILRDLFSTHGPGVLEIKNVDSLVYKNDWSDEAPDHIEIQVQHQLECIRYEWAVIGVLVGGNRNEILIRERDPVVGKSLVLQVIKFWGNLACGIMPPVIMPEDAETLIRLYKFATPDKLFDGREHEELAALGVKYKQHGAEETAAKEAKKVCKAQILQIIGDAEKALLPEGMKISATQIAPTRVEAYDREGYRDFRITQPKKKDVKV